MDEQGVKRVNGVVTNYTLGATLVSLPCRTADTLHSDARTRPAVLRKYMPHLSIVALDSPCSPQMDPQTITAPVVCSFAGHDGPFGAFAVKRLESAGLVKLGDMAPMDMNASEERIVNHTREVFPGMVCVPACGAWWR